MSRAVAATSCTWRTGRSGGAARAASRAISSVRNTFASSWTATVSTPSTQNSGRTRCFSRNSRGSAPMTFGSATFGLTRA